MTGYGNALLWAGLAAALTSTVAYVAAAGGAHTRRPARAAFALSALTALAGCALLLAAFVGERYELHYVAQYSSRDLPLLYKVSAVWAGQEGSFLLWALMAGLLGLAVMRAAGPWECRVMPAVAGVQTYLGVLLVAKSPFLPSAETLSDGKGLNPLLQDPWMAIHPPMIFLGYAALTVPFALALAALVWRDYDGWVRRSLPWVLFAWVTLGAGIFIGGYWAYRVLGWGGYWGWDPVENASLIPWLLVTALLHGLLMQRARGSLKHTNFLLAFGAFAAMLYGTFLTRSGVLSDFSVHSFVDPGAGVYRALLTGVVLAAAGPLLLLFSRLREIRSEATYENPFSRDFALFLGILVLCISAALVALGTSAPLLTSLFGEPSTVGPRYYNQTHFPIAVLIALLAGAAPLLDWGQGTSSTLARRLRAASVLGGVGLAVALALGVYRVNAWILLLVAAATFALASSGRLCLAHLRRKPLHAGAHLSHAGIALMLIGIVGSSVCSRSEKVTLHPGESADALGYRVTFTESRNPSPTRHEIHLTLARGSTTFDATPTRAYSPQMNSFVNSPSVRKSWLQDLYVSPVDYRSADDARTGQAELGRGESAKSGGYTFTFVGFNHAGDHQSVGVLVRVQDPSGKATEVTPRVGMGEGGLVPVPVTLPGAGLEISVVDLQVPMDDPGGSRIVLAVKGLPDEGSAGAGDEAVIEASSKPLINLLWLGSVLVLAGGALAGFRRTREASTARQKA